MKYSVFYVNGGLGKNIAATALLPFIKKKYNNEIVVVASWIEPFKDHPLVHRVIKATSSFNIYDEYIKEGRILKSEPYDSHYFIHKKKDLVNTWLHQLNLTNEDEEYKPYIEPASEIIIDTIKAKFGGMKNPILIQPFGGMVFNPDNAFQKTFEQTRNMSESLLSKIIDRLKDKYTPVIIQSGVKRHFHNAETIDINEYQLCQLASIGYPAILIDSSLQHAYAAFGNKATVLWSGTSPDLLGYKIHNNIRVNKCPEVECHRPYSFLGDMLDNHQTWQCPYGKVCQDHDIELVIKGF